MERNCTGGSLGTQNDSYREELGRPNDGRIGWQRAVRQSEQRGVENWLLPTSGPLLARARCDCGCCNPRWMEAGWTCPAQVAAPLDAELQNEMIGYSWSQETRRWPDPGRTSPGIDSWGTQWAFPRPPHQDFPPHDTAQWQAQGRAQSGASTDRERLPHHVGAPTEGPRRGASGTSGDSPGGNLKAEVGM